MPVSSVAQQEINAASRRHQRTLAYGEDFSGVEVVRIPVNMSI